jgi:hypothetical protein
MSGANTHISGFAANILGSFFGNKANNWNKCGNKSEIWHFGILNFRENGVFRERKY